MAWEERGSCLNIFRMKNRDRISETLTNYEAKHSLRKIFHELMPSGIDARIGVVMEWEERGSCINILRMTNRGRISESFTNYEAKDLLRKNLHELRGKRLVAQVSETCRFALYLRSRVELMLELEFSWRGRSVDHVLTYFERGKKLVAQSSGIDARIGVVMAWEEHESCLNILWQRNRRQILENFTNYEAKDLLRKNLHELRGKRFVAQVSESRRFALYLRSRVELMLELESSWRGRSVDRVLTYSGKKIAVGSQNPSRITRQKTCCANDKSRPDLRNLNELRGKSLVAQVSETHRFELYLRSRVELMLKLESSWRGRSVDHVLSNSGKEITIGSQKPSRIKRQKTCCAMTETRQFALYLRSRVELMLELESSWRGRSVDHVLTYSGKEIESGIDARIGVFMVWDELRSCLTIFRKTNHGRISETITNYEAKDLLRK
ncbi:uncharacterized protein G2W53_026513 [Senna tora]|uniref:Uncharacterized protein n=1 Tax=Senna tora TaxID=362788 RepID=A0A834WHH2_9FABA|nr:uncharacterized protein G2W53_026513 [Senna tora]